MMNKFLLLLICVPLINCRYCFSDYDSYSKDLDINLYVFDNRSDNFFDDLFQYEIKYKHSSLTKEGVAQINIISGKDESESLQYVQSVLDDHYERWDLLMSSYNLSSFILNLSTEDGNTLYEYNYTIAGELRSVKLAVNYE